MVDISLSTNNQLSDCSIVKILNIYVLKWEPCYFPVMVFCFVNVNMLTPNPPRQHAIHQMPCTIHAPMPCMGRHRCHARGGLPVTKSPFRPLLTGTPSDYMILLLYLQFCYCFYSLYVPLIMYAVDHVPLCSCRCKGSSLLQLKLLNLYICSNYVRIFSIIRSLEIYHNLKLYAQRAVWESKHYLSLIGLLVMFCFIN